MPLCSIGKPNVGPVDTIWAWHKKYRLRNLGILGLTYSLLTFKLGNLLHFLMYNVEISIYIDLTTTRSINSPLYRRAPSSRSPSRGPRWSWRQCPRGSLCWCTWPCWSPRPGGSRPGAPARPAVDRFLLVMSLIPFNCNTLWVIFFWGLVAGFPHPFSRKKSLNK